MNIECRAFRKLNKNTLQGFATLVISPPGIRIDDVALHGKFGKRWLSFPARAYEKDGTKKWWPLVRIEDPIILEQFQRFALKSIDEFLSGQSGDDLDDELPF